MSDLSGAPTLVETHGTFQRAEGFDMKVGRILMYQLNLTGFAIVAHRYGVAMRGTTPLLKPGGVAALTIVMDKATIHHQHLAASWELGGQQSYLTEEEVQNLQDRRMARLSIKPPESKLDAQGTEITGP